MKQKIILSLFMLFAIVKAFGQDSKFDEGLKSFDSKDYKKSFEILEPFAKNGNCLAQFVIGYCYQYGFSVVKNDSLGIYWLEMAAEQKQPNAMGPLAAALFAYEGKNGKETVKAYLWAMLAAEYLEAQKYTTARYVIKSYLKEDELERANKLIELYKNKWLGKEDCR
jgi:TPR repeat protein